MRALPGIVALLATVTAADAQPRWTGELSAIVLREAWDLNERRESLGGAAAGVDRRVWRGLSIRGEVLLLRVRQQPSDAVLRGFTLGTRTRWRGARARPFVDVAVGLSDSTAPVPARGTTFNYLAAIGGGVEAPVRRALVSVTARWLHASNNGRDGRHRNPDVQALGASVGVGWEF